MLKSVVQRALEIPLSENLIRDRQLRIAQKFHANAWTLFGAELLALSIGDLRLLYSLYDEAAFDSAISSELNRQNARIEFRWSNRMTRAGAKTTYVRRGSSVKLEIAVSSCLLMNSFVAPGQLHCVAGVLCESRFQALQRLVEHELVHVVELLIFGKSLCGRRRFKTIASNLFGHRRSHHQLVRPAGEAVRKSDIRVGKPVTFDFRGHRRHGVVQRITKRATVLVLDADGQKYSDGNRYKKYFVPLEQLKHVEGELS